MRSPKIEYLNNVCRAETKEALKAFIEREKVEGYSDGEAENSFNRKWGKSFRKGGPLEWFNPPLDFQEGAHFVRVMTLEETLQRTRENYQEQFRELEMLPSV